MTICIANEHNNNWTCLEGGVLQTAPEDQNSCNVLPYIFQSFAELCLRPEEKHTGREMQPIWHWMCLTIEIRSRSLGLLSSALNDLKLKALCLGFSQPSMHENIADPKIPTPIIVTKV